MNKWRIISGDLLAVAAMFVLLAIILNNQGLRGLPLRVPGLAP
jgi:hypothetical protein